MGASIHKRSAQETTAIGQNVPVDAVQTHHRKTRNRAINAALNRSTAQITADSSTHQIVALHTGQTNRLRRAIPASIHTAVAGQTLPTAAIMIIIRIAVETLPRKSAIAQLAIWIGTGLAPA